MKKKTYYILYGMIRYMKKIIFNYYTLNNGQFFVFNLNLLQLTFSPQDNDSQYTSAARFAAKTESAIPTP